ncbi:hypothetical protein [Acidovorax sp. SUPP2539]|uniref:hypothetical protein n=1 Tax=Acidovorax sp. SUPP2539 TaxID=2920878 RepID=UPI0023DE3DF5|nr:hypothetical protein [Acidovorax sp. SUPP2539]GKS91200.1 hypothetical protein AVTE2539_17565 [Acidovorax sp. SUPP2539]
MGNSVTPIAFREPTDVLLTHVNHRKQFHGGGGDTVQGIDLNFEFDRPNTFLDSLLPGLRESLYCNRDADNGQVDLDGVDAPLPNLRYPNLNGGSFTLMKKKDAFAGYELGVQFGLGDDISNMLFDCCKLKIQKVETNEGGTVRVFIQVSYGGDRADGSTIGKLIEQEGGEVTIQLWPPAVTQPVEEPEEMENPFPVQEADEPPLTAGDIFASGPSSDQDAHEQSAALESDER